MKRNIEKMYANYQRLAEKQPAQAEFTVMDVMQIFNMAQGDKYEMVAIALGVGVMTGRRQATREMKRK